MNRSAKTVIVVVAGSLAALYLYNGPEPLPPTSTEAQGQAAGSPTASQADTIKPDEVTQRVAVPTDAPEQPQATHKYEMELVVQVIDELGLPVAGHRPKLAPVGGAERKSPQATLADGKVTIRWPSRTPIADIELREQRGCRRLLRLHHGKPTTATILNRVQGSYSFTFTGDSKGTLRLISNDLSAPILAGNATSYEMIAGMHTEAVFSERGLVALIRETTATPASLNPTFHNLVLGEYISGTNLRMVSTDIELSGFTIFNNSEEPTSNCSIDGIVYDEHGKPAKEVPVVLLGSGPQPLHRGKTDKAGAFKFKHLMAGTFTVRAGGTELGLATVAVRVDSGNYSQNLQLQREACIRGTLRDQDDAPVAKAVIEWLSNDGSWADRTKTDSDGNFVLANLPRKPGHLYAWHNSSTWRFPLASVSGVLPDSGNVALACDLQRHSSIRVQPQVHHPDCDLSDLRLRVRQVDTGLSRKVRVPKVKTTSRDKKGREVTNSVLRPETPWHIDNLPAGFYDIEMSLPGCGRRNLGRHWVDGEGATDLGTVALPRPGMVHFETPDSKMPQNLQVEICELREPFDVRIESLHTLVNDLLIGEGNYMLSYQRGNEPLQIQTFSVKSGATTVLHVNW